MNLATKLNLAVALLVSCATIARADWPVRFADGTVVEVVGIAENGAANATWWMPDGSKAADPQFQSTGSVSGGARPGTKSLQLICKTSGPAMTGKNLVVRVEPEFDEGLLKMRDATGQMMQVLAPAPADKPTFRVRFGLASGNWTDTPLWQRAGGAATQPADAAVKFVGISEEDGMTRVQVKLDQPARRSATPRRMMSSGSGGGGSGGPPRGGPGGGGGGGRMSGKGSMGGPQGGPMLQDVLFSGARQDQNVAVIVRGKKLQPIGYEGGDGMMTMRFRCPIAQVEKVVLSTRAFEWMEMENVAVQPSTTATKVKVIPVKSPATTQPAE